MTQASQITIRIKRIEAILKDPNLTEQELEFRKVELETLKNMIASR